MLWNKLVGLMPEHKKHSVIIYRAVFGGTAQLLQFGEDIFLIFYFILVGET